MGTPLRDVFRLCLKSDLRGQTRFVHEAQLASSFLPVEGMCNV